MGISFLNKGGGGSSKYNAIVLQDLEKRATGLLDNAVSMLIEELPSPINLSHTNGYENAFANFTNLKKVPTILRNDDADKVSNTSLMFSNCEKIETIPLFDTSNVRTAYQMFEYCKALKSVPALDMSACTSANRMFIDCANLEEIGIANFGALTSCNYTFSGCKKLKNTPTLDVSNVGDLSYLFRDCESMESDIVLDIAACYNISYAFSGCGKLTNNKITLTNTNKVSNWSSAFMSGTGNIDPIPSMEAATNVSSMFSGNTNITALPISSVGKATSLYYLCYNCTALTEFPAIDTSLVTNFQRMCHNCSTLVIVPVLNMVKATSSSATNQIFEGCPLLSDDSLNNIMASLLTATGRTSGKTLKECGLTEEQAQRCTTLSNYEAFKAAGWATGYDSIDNPATE